MKTAFKSIALCIISFCFMFAAEQFNTYAADIDIIIRIMKK